MSDSPVPQSGENPGSGRPSPLIKAFLILLPLALAFMVPLSLMVYYRKKHQPAAATAEFASLLRRELNAEDMSRYIEGFVRKIGDRGPSHPENVEAAASYVESTMGAENMGYNIQRLASQTSGANLVSLVAELPGGAKAPETVLILADYDAPDARGIAAMMCLAHAFVATKPARTIRFAAVAQGGSPDASSNGAAQLASKLAGSGVQVTTLVLLRPPLENLPPPWRNARVVPLHAELSDTTGSTLTMLKRLKDTLEKEAGGP